MTFVDAISKGSQMSLVKKQNRDGLEETVILLITKLVNSQHTTQKMSSDSIVDCAVDIINDFWYLKFEEIVLIFNGMRKNKNFNRLDQSVIYEGFTIYEKNQRDLALETAKNQENKKSVEDVAEEIRLIREKYSEVASGKGTFVVTKINEAQKLEEQKLREGNNEYIKMKANWIKNNKE